MVLRAALGDELGAGFADHHRRHGVRLLLGTGRTIDPSALADPDVALDDLVPKAEAI